MTGILRNGLVGTRGTKALKWGLVGAAPVLAMFLGGSILRYPPVTWLGSGVALCALIAILREPAVGILCVLILEAFRIQAATFTGESWLTGAKAMGVLTVAVFLARGALSRRVRLASTPLDRPLAVFVLFGAVSLLWSSDTDMGIMTIVSWASLCTLYLLTVSLVSTREWLNRVLVVWVALTVVLVLIDAYSVGWAPFLRPAQTISFRAGYSFGNPNGLGAWLMMVLMVLLSLYLHEQRVERGLLYLTLVALVSYYLLMTGSRGSWLGAAVAIPLLLLDRSVGARRKVVIVLGLGLLLLRFSDAMQVRMLSVRQDESVYARRVGDLRAGWEMFLSHPLVGVGLGGYRLGVVDLRAAAGGVYEAPQASHNLFLAVLAQLGLLGFAPFVWAIGSVWGIARRNQSTVADTRGLVVSKGLSAGLLAYCVYGFLHGGLEFNLLWIVLGLLSSVGRMQPDGAGTSIGARSRGLPPGEHPKQPRLGLKV